MDSRLETYCLNKYIIDATTIVPALSQTTDPGVLEGEEGYDMSRWNTFEVDEGTGATNIPGAKILNRARAATQSQAPTSPSRQWPAAARQPKEPNQPVLWGGPEKAGSFLSVDVGGAEDPVGEGVDPLRDVEAGGHETTELPKQTASLPVEGAELLP